MVSPREKALKMIEYINSDSVCVELGVFGGRSLLPIAIKAKNGNVTGIDAWNINAALEGINAKEHVEWWKKIDYNHFYEYTKEQLKLYNCNHVKLLKMTSVAAIESFEDNSIDFLHQDSNHSEEISCAEVLLYYNKVKQNGIWVFDDTNWDTTVKAQKLLCDKGYKLLFDSGSWKIYKRC